MTEAMARARVWLPRPLTRRENRRNPKGNTVGGVVHHCREEAAPWRYAG